MERVAVTIHMPAACQIAGCGRACSLAVPISSAWRCAPESRSNDTWSFRLAFAARNKGVRPAPLRKWTEAPFDSKIRSISNEGPVAAIC